MAFQLAKRKKKAYFRNFLLKKVCEIDFFFVLLRVVSYTATSRARTRVHVILLKEDKRK